MKILCFGDSNTYGYNPDSYFGGRYGPEYRWVDLLANKQGFKMINAGENGREIPRNDAQFRYFDFILSKQEPLDMIIVMLGLNDLLQGNSIETIVNRMEHFLEHIDIEKYKILLIGPPAIKRGEWVPTQELVDISAKLNGEYKALSQRVGTRYADASEWNIPLSFDGVHFTEEGHVAFAEGIANYLKKEI